MTATASPRATAPPTVTAGTVASAGALMLVGVAFLVVQLVLVPHPLGLSTDEATYLAKADPAAPELYWSPPRAWGVPVLTAPVALFSPGLGMLRSYLALLSSAGLVVAFWTWRRPLHPVVAPLAALLFASTWTTIYLGSLAMPNLYSALSAVAVVGLTLRALERPRSWSASALAGVAAAVLALIRPTDSVLVVGPLAAGLVLAPRLRRMRPLVALVVGEVLGWLPWVVEAYARFGGPLARLSAGESAGPHGLGLDLSTLLAYPRLLDGTPNYCCYGAPVSAAGPLPTAMTAWALAVPLLALLGLLVSRGTIRTALLLVAVPGGLLAAFYLLLPSFVTPRFLLPTLALLSLPVASALVAAARAGGRLRRRITSSLVALLVLLHIGLMLPVADAKLDREGASRTPQIAVSAALEPFVAGRPCVVLGHEMQATAYALRCDINEAHPDARRFRRVGEAERKGELVVAVLRGSDRPKAGSTLDRWPVLTLPGLPSGYEVRTLPG